MCIRGYQCKTPALFVSCAHRPKEIPRSRGTPNECTTPTPTCAAKKRGAIKEKSTVAIICKMEQRTATNTGFAAGALVELRHWTRGYSLSWLADSKGVLYLRPQRGRLSKFQSADSPEYLVAGARVKLKNKNIYGRISYNGECSDPQKRRVEWERSESWEQSL